MSGITSVHETYKEHKRQHTNQNPILELLIPPRKRRHPHTFTCKPEFFSLEFAEYFEELLHESDKLFCELVLILDVWSPLGEASAYGLLNPDNRGEVGPAVFVYRGFCLAPGPRKGLSNVSSSVRGWDGRHRPRSLGEDLRAKNIRDRRSS